MENYICINGKKTALTEEQLNQLGLKFEPTILWKSEKSELGLITYTCPNCGHYFRIMESARKDIIIRSHKYCGHCGANLVFGGV